MKRFLSATCAMLLLSATTALSASCGPRDIVKEALETKWGEQTFFTGITTPTRILEGYINEETGTWTMVETDISTGLSCLRYSGRDFVLTTPITGEPL